MATPCCPGPIGVEGIGALTGASVLQNAEAGKRLDRLYVVDLIALLLSSTWIIVLNESRGCTAAALGWNVLGRHSVGTDR